MIHILPNDVVSKIAAGEVIERPASVVKELVENSLDSGAGEITVVIQDGGKEGITVIDDGCGMLREDALLCIERHATSKISSADDLWNITTLGFRGEALPSIAAVSRMTIETKDGESLAGTKLVIEGGVTKEVTDAGCPRGTKVDVGALFFNVPARKKFLRTGRTEAGHIYDVVSRVALAFPDVRIKLISDGEDELTCVTEGDMRARIVQVFGREVAAGVNEIREESAGIELRAFLGSPSAQMAQGTYLFVNKRFVRDRMLSKAVLEGYRNRLPFGRYPLVALFLTVDPKLVDVNVHPTKQEVRFEKPGAVYEFVADSVRKGVGSYSSRAATEGRPYSRGGALSPPSSIATALRQSQDAGGQAIGPDASMEARCQKPEDQQLASIPASPPAGRQAAPFDQLLASELFVSRPYCFASLRVIGQHAETYIVCEGSNGGLVVIDQHAAHERIGFEILKAQYARSKIECQRLLIPESLDLFPKEAAYLAERLDLLSQLGLEIEEFSKNTFIIKSAPVLVNLADIKMLVLDLVREFAAMERSSKMDELIDSILKTIACHRQVRAHHTLSILEMEALLREMDEYPNTDRCPHGRPTLIEFNAEEVGKWFKR